MEHLKYPIGRFNNSENYTSTQINELVNDLKTFPENLVSKVSSLNGNDLSKTYREGSWTVKQLIHHIGESHMNAYIRVKLALTEDNPTIKPYLENEWVHTAENEQLDISVSLQIIELVHKKLVCLLETFTESDLNRTFYHPQYQRTSRISDLIALYRWHGKHHLAHIELALKN